MIIILITVPSKEAEIENYNNPNAINIYYVNSYPGLCGRAPGIARKLIVLKNECATNGATPIHEMGHFFGQVHTHLSSFYGKECVDGSNCSTAGDLLCDTPADPELRGNVSNCQYIGTSRDSCNNQLYSPDVGNYMSYAPASCRDHFSQQQLNKINLYANDELLTVLINEPTSHSGSISSNQNFSDLVVKFNNVSINNSADVVVDACGSFIINGSFEAADGTTLQVYVE